MIGGLILGLWPFIDGFPKSIIRGGTHLLIKNSLPKDRQLLNILLHRGPQMLAGIRKDEENHRMLWLETGRALGLNYPLDFDRPALTQTQAWLNEINNQSDLVTMFLRFAAIEIIAEVISVELLSSTAFTSVLGKRGCEWFRVHAEHEPGMTHEEMILHTAFFVDKNPTKEYVDSVIQRVVNYFITAGQACELSIEPFFQWLPQRVRVARNLPTRP